MFTSVEEKTTIVYFGISYGYESSDWLIGMNWSIRDEGEKFKI